MNYRHLYIRQYEHYESTKGPKNKAPSPHLPAFPFDKMKLGSYIEVPLKNRMDDSEINSVRAFAHQTARACGIWIKTKVQAKLERIQSSNPTFVLLIIHDGERE